MGLSEGVSCACGEVGLVKKTAFLAEGGVLPEYRRQGFHKDITLYRLKIAAEQGATEAVMVSSQNSKSNRTASSLEFKKIGERRFFQKIT